MFEQAKDKGMFYVFRNLKDGFGAKLKNQNILMLSDSCLRLGEADYVITRLAKKPNKHFIILVDESFDEEILAFHSPVLENFSIKTAYLNVLLSTTDIQKMIDNTAAGTIILPGSFENLIISNKNLQFLQENNKITLSQLVPKFLSIKTKSEVENGPVYGFISLYNYNYTATLHDRVSNIKEKLLNNGFEATVDYYQFRTQIRIPDAEIVFIGKKTMIKSNSRSLRQALLSIINS